MPRIRDHKFSDFSVLAYERYWEHLPDYLAIDTETTGLTWADTPFGLSVSWHGSSRIESFWFELEDEGCFQTARQLLDDHAAQGRLFIAYNLKFDQRMMMNFGLWPSGQVNSVDVMPAVALLDPTGEHKLKVAARKYLGASTYEENAVKQARKELKLTREDGYWPLPREVVVPYAMKDTEFTLRLYDKLMPMIAEKGLETAFAKEQRIVAEFLRMEMRGMRVDLDVVKDSVKETDAHLAAARSQIEGLVGRKVGKAKRKVKTANGVSEKTGRELFKTIEVPDEFNLDAWQQVMAAFEERGVNLSSTESKVLEKVDDPLVDPLLKYRSETKLRQFLSALVKETDADGLVHPNLNSNGTSTGRASSGAVRET